MRTKDFLAELKALDPKLDIVENPYRPGLSNIKYDGRDVCPIPSEEIKDEPDPSYNYTFPNGMIARHKSLGEARESVNHILELLKTEEGREVFYAG